MLKPDYKNSIIDISKVISKRMRKKTLFVLIDSMGYGNFKEVIQDKEIKNSLKIFNVKKISSVFPTTTAAAITSILDGRPPGEHGIYEWRMYSDIIKMEFKPLKFMAVDPLMQRKFGRIAQRKLVMHKNFMNKLKRNGVKVYQIIPREIVNGVYNSYGCGNVIGYSNFVEGIIKAKHAITNEKRKSFFYLYLPQYDESEHINGPHSEESIALLKEMLKLIIKELSTIKGLKIIMTADHGSMEIKKEIKLDKQRWFWEGVWENLRPCCKRKILPVGSPRDIFLHVKKGKIDNVTTLLEKKIGKYANICKTKELIQDGFFGDKVSPQFIRDVGDIVILPRKGFVVSFYNEVKLKGMHGGLSEEELFVPLLTN